MLLAKTFLSPLLPHLPLEPERNPESPPRTEQVPTLPQPWMESVWPVPRTSRLWKGSLTGSHTEPKEEDYPDPHCSTCQSFQLVAGPPAPQDRNYAPLAHHLNTNLPQHGRVWR